MKRWLVTSLITLAWVSSFAQNNLHDFAPSSAAPGTFRVNVVGGVAFVGGVATTVPGVSLTLPSAATNYVYVDLSAGVIASNTTGFAGSVYPVAIVTTGTSQVLTVQDVRSTANSPSSGGASLSANNTFTGSNTFAGGGSLQGVYAGGPTFTIANSPTGATESGNTVTITTTAPCSFIANEAVTIAGVGVSGYNGGWVTSTACVGSSFTYFNSTASLANSGSGTVVGSPIFSGGITETGPTSITNAKITDTTAGVWTNTQQNDYFTTTLGNISAATEFGRLFTGSFATEGMVSNIGVPSNSTVFQAQSVAAYSTNASGAQYTISNAPTGATESSFTVTITTTTTCAYITGEVVSITGVGVSGYNGNWTVLTPGCNGGSSFTYTNSVSGLGTSGSGTVVGSATAVVSLFALAHGTSAGAKMWGINTIADDGGFSSPSIYAGEFDTNIENANSIAHGILVGAFFSAQPAGGSAVEVGAPIGGSNHWPYGFRCDTGATLSPPDGNDACLVMYPFTSGASRPSQGLTFVSTDGSSTQHVGTFYQVAGAQPVLSSSVPLSINTTTQQGELYSIANATSTILPTITSQGAGVVGDTLTTLGSGTGKTYGVIGVAKGTGDVAGDRAYGGWFKASASSNVSTEVGLHAESADVGGLALEVVTGQTVFPLGATATPTIYPAGAAAGVGIFFPATTTFCWNTGSVCQFAALGTGAKVGSGNEFAFASTAAATGSQDTGIGRAAAGLATIDAATGGAAGGYYKSAQTAQVITADVTCGTGGTLTPCTALTTITGLTLTLPLVARNWSFDCDIYQSQATAAAANQIGVQTATNGATNLTAAAIAYSTNAASTITTGTITDVASTTTAQSVVTWTPSGTGAKAPVHLSGTVEGSSATGTVINIQVLTGAGADLLTIYRGSKCWAY